MSGELERLKSGYLQADILFSFALSLIAEFQPEPKQ
jgi:hypothetical protein